MLYLGEHFAELSDSGILRLELLRELSYPRLACRMRALVIAGMPCFSSATAQLAHASAN